jgi:hypothetical protein
MALLRGTLRPALTGRKELTEKSQSGEFEVPQDPESPIVHPTWRRNEAEHRNRSTTCWGGNHGVDAEGAETPKGVESTSEKKSCVVKGSNELSGPQPDGEMEAEAEEKRRLTEQTLQLDPGPTQRALGRAPEHPHKRSGLTNWTFPCLRSDQALAKKRIPRSG